MSTKVRLDGEKIAERATALQEEKLGERTISRAVADFSIGNGRTIDVRIVPYGAVAEVSDGGPLYREVWMPGAFSDQVRGAAAGRARQVFVNFEHGKGLAGVIGHGIALREASDGFYGSFELHETADGEKARYMVEEKLIDGVSLEAFPKVNRRSKDGTVQRVKAHLVNIALCRRPAYVGAGVLALREEELMPEEFIAPAIPDEIRERCQRLGIVVPGYPSEQDEQPEEEVARQSPLAVDEGFGGEADNDTASDSVLGEILSLAREWAANEDDPQDVAAMNQIIQELETLGNTETSETD